MDQVIGCVDSDQSWWEASLVEAIALHHLGVGSDVRPQKFWASGQTTNWPTSLFKSLEKAPSDVACGSSQQDQRSATRIS